MRTTSLVAILIGLVFAAAVHAADVGDTRTFWGWDLSVMPPTDRQFDATCRAVGDHGYIWVEDAVWNDQMDQDDVDSILVAWDQSTPADSGTGIFETVTSGFGDVPDVDDDPLVNLVYYDIGEYQGYTFDGFFRAEDEVAGATSNLAEMLHLNSANDPGADRMLAVTAHELTHMVIYNYKPGEAGWVQESMAEAAMIACGYYTDTDWVEDFADNPDTPLIPEDEYSLHYGAALLFGTYLYEQYDGFFPDLLQEDQTGTNGIGALLNDYEEGLSFAEAFGRWAAANYADLVGGTFGYEEIDPPLFRSTFAVVGEANAFEVPGWAAEYLRFPTESGATYRVSIESDAASDLRVHLIEMDGELDEAFSVAPMDSAEVEWEVGTGGFGVAAVAYAADGDDAEGMLTVEKIADADDDDDDAAGDDDSGDDDDDDEGCG